MTYVAYDLGAPKTKKWIKGHDGALSCSMPQCTAKRAEMKRKNVAAQGSAPKPTALQKVKDHLQAAQDQNAQLLQLLSPGLQAALRAVALPAPSL